MSADASLDTNLSLPGVLIQVEENAPGYLQPNRIEWYLSDTLPSHAKVTGAYTLAHRDHRFLVALHRERGWDIVGGHVENDEDPILTAFRESYEETGATVTNLKLLAYQRIVLLGERPDHYPYPFPESFQALYLGTIEKLGTFQVEEDSEARALMRARQMKNEVRWVQRHPEIFAQAMRLAGIRSTTPRWLERIADTLNACKRALRRQ